MAAFTGPERASCVFWFEESKSATTVQRNFRTKYAKDPPSRPTIYEWHSCFVETGCSVKHKKSSGRPSTSDEVVEQIDEDDRERNVFFMQDGAPPHYLTDVRDFLNDRFPGIMGSSDASYVVVMRQLHGLPDLTPLDFFLLGFHKRYGVRTSFASHSPELRARIYAAAEQVTPEMLVRVWEEIHYRWDVCRITNGSHIEYL
ncbi:hypothetical protein J6590_030659 [Homalodisca vitripennis]|nr:hypothetical protein J6590_030659 [Homalodisca vitripennis]